MPQCTRLREVSSGSVKAELAGCTEASGGGGSGWFAHQGGRPGPFGPRFGPRVGVRIRARVSYRNMVKVWDKVGFEARGKARGKGCAGPRTPNRPLRPGVGVGVMNRARIRVGGRVTDRAGARTGAGRVAENEVRVRVMSRVKVRGGFTVRVRTETQVGVRGRARGIGRPGKEIADIP